MPSFVICLSIRCAGSEQPAYSVSAETELQERQAGPRRVDEADPGNPRRASIVCPYPRESRVNRADIRAAGWPSNRGQLSHSRIHATPLNRSKERREKQSVAAIPALLCRHHRASGRRAPRTGSCGRQEQVEGIRKGRPPAAHANKAQDGRQDDRPSIRHARRRKWLGKSRHTRR